MNNPPWISVAQSLLGIKEIPGPKANQIIVSMFAACGFPTVTSDETAWCAAFVGYCLGKAGITGTKSLWALDYGKWGEGLAVPVYGCVATKKRQPSGGHVFFVVGADKDKVYGLGGNQNNSVSISEFNLKDIAALRWPTGVPVYLNTMPTSVEGSLKSVTEA